MLAVELPSAALADGQEALGLALARIVGVADGLFDESADWLWLGGRMAGPVRTEPRNERLITATRPRCPSCSASRQAVGTDVPAVEVSA